MSLVALVIISIPFFVRPYRVVGGSMEPTYHEGEIVFLETLTPHIHIWRGEVLVIRNPHAQSVIEVKRIVGLPGEDITLGENSVTATKNGRAVSYGPPVGRESTGFFAMHLGREDYMVLGDNRSHSTDSRSFGAVQASDIRGHVVFAL